MPWLISRTTAKLSGMRYFFTGKPCVRGHLDKRSVSSGACYQCTRDLQTHRNSIDPERHREKRRAEYARSIKHRNEYDRQKRSKNIELYRERDRKRYRHDQKRNASVKRRALEWSKANPDKRNEITAANKFARTQAAPPWLTARHRREMKEFYITAAFMTEILGTEYQVDHIHPINGKLSCGLHVPWNLQILTAEENRRKGNKLRWS